MRNALEFAVLALVCCRPGAEAAPPPDAPSVAQRTSPPPSKRELSFHFQVDVGVEPSTHTEYDDDLDRPVEVSLPQSLRKWSCMRTKVTADEKKGALEAGFNCRTSTTPPHQIGTSARTHARHRGHRVGGASR
jgi:hypothetical protein